MGEIVLSACPEQFSNATRQWFDATFAQPTRVQQQGWERIAASEHTLMLAPTGSGKTLAAFLWCVDRLLRGGGENKPGVRVVYVSPLKALAYDIERNLRAPLAGIRQMAEARGHELPPVRVHVRTGDTPQRERRQQAKNPAEILITTPESLFLILGSAARETLTTTETVIVDEIHALAPNKRGVHLALSLERLCHLTKVDPQRIGLSATQRPLEVVARFLGGDRPVSIVDASCAPRLDLQVVVPVPDMRAPAAQTTDGPLAAPQKLTPEERTSIWPAIYPKLLELIEAHRSTIMFVNSRRLAERLAQQLNELAGAELVRAHHGSIARHQRETVEEALKSGQLRAIAATSSLELGIDMGAVDLVVQVESPGSVARGLQRIGRAGHQVDEVSRGRLFPKFRGDLLETAVVVRRMQDAEVEPVRVPRNTLDVLAQQIVAMTTTDNWQIDELESLVRRADSFRELSHEAVVEVLDMLAGRYPSDAFADLKPRIIWDRGNNTLRARPGARMVSTANAGTIPDRGNFAVVLGIDGPRIGELDEEMVYEARAGETFLLGASSWRIEQITRDRVVVSPAPGVPGKMPFWRGAGPGRPIELGRAIGATLRQLQGLPRTRAREQLAAQHGLDDLAAQNLLAYIDEQREATGTLPTDQAITIERFLDELGDYRVCILSPFGSRVHAPWALALEAALSRRAGFEVQTLWSDDGIVMRFAEGDEQPAVDQLLPDPDELQELLLEQLSRSALFASHFRENAGRALLLPRRRLGQRAPLWAQRIRSQELLAVALRYPSFPIVLETYRECLQDVFDLPALEKLLRRIRSRQIQVEEVETASASPFARSLVFDYVAAYLYEGDAPLAERKAQALTLDRNLLRDLLGHEALRDLLDAAVIAEVEAELQAIAEQRRARSADELHDLLRRLGDLDDEQLRERCATEDPSVWVAQLLSERRASRVQVAGQQRVIAIEDVARYRDALGVVPPEGVPPSLLASTENALEQLLLRWARRHGPFRSEQLALHYDLTPGQLGAVLRLLVADGRLLEGEFHPEGTQREWCHPEVLRQLRRRTLGRLRQAVAAVDVPALQRFELRWQGLCSPREGLGTLREVVGQLQGLALSWAELQDRILPARVANYRPEMLDELGATGELIWIGRGALGVTDGRVVLCLQEQAATLAAQSPQEAPADATELALRVLDQLRQRGACFTVALQQACGTPPLDDLVAALWDLVWRGLVTNDSFSPLRDLRRGKRRSRPGGRPGIAAGRWSLTSDLAPSQEPVTDTERCHAQALMLLSRYGIACREAALAGELTGGFSAVGTVLRAMEEAGTARRGYFVEGISGLQFALPGAVDLLREPPSAELVALSAIDPANIYGSFVPWPATAGGDHLRPSRRSGAAVILIDGAPILYVTSNRRRLLTFADVPEPDLERALDQGLALLARQHRRLSLSIEQVDGVPVGRSALKPLLQRAGFRPGYKEMVREILRSNASKDEQ